MDRFLVQWRKTDSGERWKVWAWYKSEEQAERAYLALSFILGAAEFRVVEI